MKLKNIIALVLTIVLCLTLAACGGDKKGAEKKDGYQVSVVDGNGNPVTSGVIVRIMQNGQQVQMQVADEQGVAQLDLDDGDYTVELKFTDSNAAYYYDTENLTLSAAKKQLQIKLYNTATNPQSLFAPGIDGGESADTTAYNVGLGTTYLTPVVGQRNYYLFVPTQAGTYTFTVNAGDGALNYYGAPHFVQSTPAVDPVDGVLTLSIAPGTIGENGSTAYVLGLDAQTETAVLTITRVGDHQWTVEDAPWTEYQTTHTPSKFTFTPTAGKTLTYVDIHDGTAADYPVVLGSDGFYHMGDENGPLVYINLGKKAPNASFYLIIKGDGLAGGSPIRTYYYDDAGNFEKKEDYTDIVLRYIECMDEETGLYPLTEDLAFIINTRSGWWTESDPNYIFEGCNPEIGWLFACCYEK